MRIESLSVTTPFEKWLLEEGIELVAKERPYSTQIEMRSRPWYVTMSSREGMVEVMGRGSLISLSGNGDTPDAAMKNLQQILRGKRLVINAYRDSRREIQCPNNWGENYELEDH